MRAGIGRGASCLSPRLPPSRSPSGSLCRLLGSGTDHGGSFEGMGSRICPSSPCSSFRTWGDRSLRMDIIFQIGGPGQLQDVNIGVVEDSINKAATVRAPPKCLVVLKRLFLTHLQCQSEGLGLKHWCRLTRSGIALVQSKIKEYVKTDSSF